jgi:hypothetical protein
VVPTRSLAALTPHGRAKPRRRWVVLFLCERRRGLLLGARETAVRRLDAGLRPDVGR